MNQAPPRDSRGCKMAKMQFSTGLLLEYAAASFSDGMSFCLRCEVYLRFLWAELGSGCGLAIPVGLKEVTLALAYRRFPVRHIATRAAVAVAVAVAVTYSTPPATRLSPTCKLRLNRSPRQRPSLCLPPTSKLPNRSSQAVVAAASIA